VHALALAGVALWCFLVALAGGVAGLVLGNIRLPVLLFASSSPAAAGGANIAVSGLAAAAASIRHVQARRIDWTLLWVGAASSLPGALLGSRLTGRLSVEMLLRTVGVILLVAGTAAIVQGIV